ncbi:MAG: DUF1800 domain-containing protein [Chloroflexi bacterium]|nr:DUF1800 domain-containing protein [Chloroflexota bacterium]
MADRNTELIAHLMRRAGFGATPEELRQRATIGYEQTVDELLRPDAQEPLDGYRFLRYQPWTWKPGTLSNPGPTSWLYHMINTKRPLEEKLTFFWHQVFATGVSKVDHWDEVADMIDLFRRLGMDSFRDLLLAVAKSPAMIYWLDNNENHAAAVNENFGRELLELFSMGVGNYTEDDVLECSRAFTGWTITPKLPRFPYGRYDWEFEYREDDHDSGEKSFLGRTGDFNGQDIIDIICEQPATATFVSRHLYNFFVADEVQVAAWSKTPPKDPEAIETLAATFSDSGYDIRSMLRVLFNSDFFKNARRDRVKSPVEVVAETMRLVGGAEFPLPGYGELARQPLYMGQDLLNPPSVEGWHTGEEWINSGNLVERVNFMTRMVGDAGRPGIAAFIQGLKNTPNLAPEALVDACLDLLGLAELGPDTRHELLDHASERGDLVWNGDTESSTERVLEMLQLVVSLREYQRA